MLRRTLPGLLALLTALPFVQTQGADAPRSPAQPPRQPTATPVNKIKIRKDFRVELLYTVPKDKQGSWVSLCMDPKGRVIVSDQYGGLFRVTPPKIGGDPAETKVEKIPVAIGDAQGMVWAFDSLYVMVNSNRMQSGLYRVRSSKNDDVLDEAKLLRKFRGGNTEHGPHAVLLHSDGKSLTVVCGDQEPLTKYDLTRVPPIWGEDHLLPRMPDGRGFMAGVLGPGGAIYKTDPDGKTWELQTVGFRNEYDAAFNHHGDLFTYDADMEWDFNTPWYRPTRVCLAASGAEFGWRNGTGKWPPYYPDSLPAVLDIGPGSPTGMTFGYGAKFPAKYQEALFMCDWSYGKLYAVHLKPDGSSYKGEAEEFLSGTPLPLTDIAVSPTDGALYFAIGGRKTQSGLYRVTYTGPESTAPAPADDTGAEARALRHKLEAFHGKRDPKAVETAWPYLGHADRYIRYAARVAIEFQDPKEWQDRALAETDPEAAINALLALVRVSASDPFHRKKDAPPVDPKLKAAVLAALDRISWEKLTDAQRLELLRVYAVTFNRMGRPSDAERQQVLAKLDSKFPAHGWQINNDLCEILVYLEAPGVAERGVKLMEQAPTQEEQIAYAKSLRMLTTGWTPDLRKRYFQWFVKAGGYKGGASFENFIRNIKNEAVAKLPAAEKAALKPILEAKPATATVTVAPPRPFVKKWTMAELVALTDKGLTKRDFDRGRAMFGAANCFACHRFNNEGGAQGPDLSSAAGRFSVRDLLESIVEPSKVISDQYEAVVIELADGRLVIGRIINLNGDSMSVLTDMLNPNSIVNVNRRNVESMRPSKVSMMPEGLLDTLNQEEVLDLIAFLLSRGDRNNPMFR